MAKRYLGLMGCIALVGISFAQVSPEPTSISPTEVDFLNAASIADTSQIMDSRLVFSRSNSKAVLRLCRILATDRLKNRNQVRATAKRFNVTLPTQLDNTRRAFHGRMIAEHGHDMNKDFINFELTERVRTIKLFQDEIDAGTTPAVVKMATEAMVLLQSNKELWTSMTVKYGPSSMDPGDDSGGKQSQLPSGLPPARGL